MFAPLLLLAALVNIASYVALAKLNLALASAIWQGMIWWLALVITIIGGRVIPFFTAKRLQADKPEPLKWLDQALMGCMVVLMLQAIFIFLPATVVRPLLVITAVLHLWRMSRWQGQKTLNIPLLWSLHLSYLCLPIAMLAQAWFYNDFYAARQFTHILAIGCIGGMCLSMMARVSLGHTGRNIYQGPVMALAFVLVFIAALIRSVLSVALPEYNSWWYTLSGIGWSWAFALFVFHYSRMLCSPRADGHAG